MNSIDFNIKEAYRKKEEEEAEGVITDCREKETCMFLREAQNMASEDAFGSYIARGASRPICKSVYESGPDSIKPQIHLWPSFEKLSGSEVSVEIIFCLKKY